MTSLEALLFLCLVAVTEPAPTLMTMDLRTGGVTGADMAGLYWCDPKMYRPSDYRWCDVKNVLRYTFDYQYQRRLRITLTYDANPRGFHFQVGDSHSNINRGGDKGTVYNDANMYFQDRDIYVYGKDDPSGNTYGLLHKGPGFLSTPTVIVEVMDELLTVLCGNNYIYVHTFKMFALSGQYDPGGPNNELYVSPNRLASDDPGGSGLCRMSTSWVSA